MQNYQFDYAQYKQKLNKPNNGILAVLMVVIIVLMGILTFINANSFNSTTFYFVEVDRFINYTHASSLANEIQEKNGAGFVRLDSSYIVLAGFYPNYDTANKVCENLKSEYPNVAVYSFSVENFYKKKELSTNGNKILESLTRNLQACVNKLYDLSILVSTKEISNNQLSLEIKQLLDGFESEYSNFCRSFNTNKHLKAKETALSIKNSLSSLNNKTENENFLQYLRYTNIKIVVDYCSFLGCF